MQSPEGKSTLGIVVERRDRGFTLIELIIVCALIGIMLSVSIPSLRNSIFNDPLKSSARKVIGLVSDVRELAVRTQQPYFLNISRLNNRLWFEKDSPQDLKERSPEDILQLPESIHVQDIKIVGDDTPPNEPAAVWITKKGYMRHTYIRIESDDGKGISLQFFPFIDSVQLSDKVQVFDE